MNKLYPQNLIAILLLQHQKFKLNIFLGDHYNPCGKNHSNDPSAKDRHVGDVAQVTIPPNQKVLTFTMIDTQVKLSGPLSVLGRSVTVHGGSQSTRVGCATIAVTEWTGTDHPDNKYSKSNPFWK